MRQRTYNGRSLAFIAIAVVFMLMIDHMLHRVPERRYEKDIPRESVTTIKDAPVGVPPLPSVPVQTQPAPSFAPARDVSTDRTLLHEQPAWKANAVPSNVPKTVPRIALIMDDMGLDVKDTHDAMDLPGPLTMSFMPYAHNLKQQTEYARARGHELMVHVPMQPENGKLDAGPEVLSVDKTPEQLIKTLDEDLAAFTGYVGINNHMGSRMTQDRAGMDVVMQELKKRGLLFVDSKTIAGSVGAEEAKKAGIPYAARDVFLDDEESYKAIEGSIEKAEQTALKRGLAVVIGHPRRKTVELLKAWLPTLKAKGIGLVPVSSIVHVPEGATAEAAIK